MTNMSIGTFVYADNRIFPCPKASLFCIFHVMGAVFLIDAVLQWLLFVI